MKQIILILFLFISLNSIAQSFTSFAISYTEITERKTDERPRQIYAGAGLGFDYTVDGIDWIGSRAMVQYDKEHQLVLSHSVRVHFSIFKDFINIDLLPFMLNMNIANEGVRYNTPSGFEVSLFRGKTKFTIRQMYFKKVIMSRFGLRLNF